MTFTGWLKKRAPGGFKPLAFLFAALLLQAAPAAFAATTVYLGDSASSINPGDEDERRLNRVRGASVASYVKNTMAGPVTPPTTATQFTRTAGGTTIIWYSDPLDEVTISGNVSFNIWAMESANQANAGLTGELLRASASGAILSVIAAVHVPTAELTTALAARTWTKTPTPTSLSNGDRLALRLHIDDFGTMGAGRTVTMTIDGPTAGASGDSRFSTVENLAPARPVIGSITGLTQTEFSGSWTLVEGATGYTLAASVNSGAAPSPIYSSVSTSENFATLNSPALASNTTYYPFVRTNGPGASSSWAAFPVQVTPAYAPSFSNFTSISSYTARFNWASNGNHAATLYHVAMSTAADPLSPFGAPVTSSFTYNTYLSSSGLLANTPYSFRVAAINHAGVYTAYTSVVSTYTLAALPVSGPFSDVSESGITASWTSGGNPAGTLYRLLVSTASDPSNPLGAAVSQHETYNLAFSTAGLSPNTTYYFKAAGVNGDGVAGTYFNAVATATLAAAPVFSAFSEETYSSMRFAWTSGGDPAGTLYRVVSSTAADPLSPGGARVASSDTYNLSLSSAGLFADTRYYFRAAAVNRNGVVTAYSSPENRATLLRYDPASPVFTGVSETGMTFGFSANGNVYPGTLFRVLASTAVNPLAPAGAAVVSSDTYNASLAMGGLSPNVTYYFLAAGVNKDGVPTAYAAAAGTSTLASVPSGLQFTETTDSKVRLEWEGVNGPGTLYRVLVSTAADPLAPVGAAVTSSDTYNLYLSTEGLAFSTKYFFLARAANSNGVLTNWSSAVSTTTLAPGSLAAPLAGALVPHVSSVTAAWALVAGATGYTLAASLAADDPPVSIFASSTTLGNLSATVPGLTPDTVYYLFVRANGPGIASVWNKYSPAATLLQYAPVFGSFGVPTAGSAALSWTGGGNPAGTLYRVLSSTASDPLAPAGAAVVSSETYNLALTSSSLSPNTAYYFRIAGVNKDGAATAYTAPRGTSTLANMPAFSGFSGTGTSAMTFAWTAADNPAGTLYRVLSSPAPDPLNPGGAPVVSSYTYNLSLSTSGLIPDTSYYFRVAARNNDGVLTAYSAPEAHPTLPEAPAFPGVGTVTDSSADLMWSGGNNPSDTLYRVLVSPAPDPLSPGSEPVTSSDTYNLYLSSSGLAVDKAYYFVVAALGHDGQPTAYTAPERARTLARQPVFSHFDNVGVAAMNANWTANGNPAGTLYRAAVSVAPDPLNPGGAEVTLLDSYGLYVSSAGLAADTTYYFRVAAVNGDGAATAYTSAYGTATLAAYPPLFSGFSDIQTDSIRVLWAPNGNADGTLYRVAVSTAADPLNPAGAKVSYSDTYDLSLASSGLVTNTLYYFRLAAVNKNGIATAYTAAQSERTLQVVTKLYLRDDVSTAAAPDTGEERRLSLLRGSASVIYTKNTVTGAVTPPTSALQVTKTAGGAVQTWYTMPLDAVTIVSSVTFNIRAYESATAANAAVTGVIYRTDGAGVIISTVATAVLARAELTIADSAQTWSVQPTPTALSNGDRLALRLYIDDASGQVMASARTVSVSVGGPTANAAGDSWVQVLEELRPARPASISVTGVTAAQLSASWPLVSETTSYTLAASVNSGAEPQPVYASSGTLGDLSATLSVPTLSPNTTYYLFARSNFEGVSSGWQVRVGTATLLAFDPAAVGFGSVASGAMLFDWTANGNADPGTLYRVVSSTAADPMNPFGAVVASSLTYNTYLSTSGLAGDTTYYFRVAGLNHNGVATAYTSPVGTATLLAFPPASPSFSGIGQTAMQFNWTANGNRDPGTLYRVVSSTAPDPLSPQGALTVSSDTYNLFLASSGLAANTTYYFRVAGVNKNGVQTDYTAPAATATLAYAPVFGSFTGVSASEVSLVWTSGGNPQGTLYRVLSSTASDPASPSGAVVASSETYNLSLSSSGLAADTTYYFSVAALNHNRTATAYTAPRGTATLLGFAPVFTGFGDVAAGSLQFSFSANGNAAGTLYRVVSSTAQDPLNPLGAVSVSSLTYNTYLSTAGLAADTTYYFRVAGVNKNWVETSYSAAAATATLLAFPPAFSSFSGVAEAGLQFNFSANGNRYPGTLYRVLASTAPDPLSPFGAAVVSSDTYSLALALGSLPADTTHYFRAAGINKNWVLTSWTTVASTSTLANVPSGFYATGITEDSMLLNWSASGNRDPGTRYQVLVSTAADPAAPDGAVVSSSYTYNLYLSTAPLTPSTAYRFRAAAINSNGVRTVWSDPVFSALTLSPGSIGSPASGEITGVHVSSLAATWALVPTATGYTLAASLFPDNPPSVIAASSYTLTGDNQAYVSGLAADTVYYLFARANKQWVSGEWFAFPAKATLLAAPPAFVSFTGVASDSIGFNFSANGNAFPGTRFRVLVSTALDPLVPGAAAYSSSDTYNVALTTAGLAADTTYYFLAAGVNKDNVLTAYTAVQATATAANIPVFAGFTGVGAGDVTFNWSGNGNRVPGTLYRVLVSTAANPAVPGGAVVTSSDTYNLYLSTSGLEADTTYYFRAAALGAGGTATAYSAPAGTATLVAYAPVFSGFTGVGTGSVQFNWSAGGNRYPGTRYRVLSSTATDPLNPGAAVAVSSETYSLQLSSAGLPANTTHYFLVAALNQNGVLTEYTAVSGTSTLANIPLTAVSTFGAVTSGGFNAAWKPNANPVGTVYQVQVSTAQDFNSGAAGLAASTAPVSGESYGFGGLLSNRDYYFRARAMNHNGVYSDYAALGSTRTAGLSAPAMLPVTQVSSYSMTVAWSLVPGATGYTLAASVNSGVSPSPVYASSVTAGTSAMVFNPALAINTTYYLFVKAGGPGDESPWAVYPATSTLANIPVAPGSPFSAVSDNGFVLSWLANSNPLAVTRYTVQVSTALDFNAGVTNQVVLSTAPEAGPGVTLSGLSSDTYYYARVRAEHNNGNSTDWVSLGVVKTLLLAQLHAAGDGVLIYGQSGNSLPQFRDYVSATNSFSAVRNTIAGAAGMLFTVKTNPLTTKQEAVAAYVKSGTLRVLCTDGANWYEEWTQTVGGADATRRFDIAYETNSGDVMVLYSRGVAATNELGYRTKPGSLGCGSANWSAAATLDPARTSGAVHWVKMAPDRRADYDNIAAIWGDANSDLSAMVWNGGAWENEPAAALETSLETVAASQDVESFAVETESLTGDIMVVWGHSAGADGVNGVRYATATWTGGSPAHTWGGVVNPVNFYDDATNLDLAANLGSDEMVFASIGNAGSDLQAGYWNGASWANSSNLDITAQAPAAGTKLVAAAWISSNTTVRSVITYNDSAATNLGWYVGNGSTFTAQTDFTPSPVFANPQRYYDLKQDPVNRERMVFALADSNADLFVKRLVMTSAPAFTWTNTEGGAALEANLGSSLSGGYSFVFWPAPPTTTFEQSAYRFFANTATTDVGAPLAAQDSLAVLAAAGDPFRLRTLVNIGQVDLPISGQAFKLQFAGQGDGTCEALSNGNPADWTDVTTLTAIAFNNNAPADGAALTANAEDPRHGVQANINQVYAESGGFSNSAAGIARNRDGMWDLALKDNGMSPGAVYCLRLVKGDGVPLEYYSVYPRVLSPSALVLNEVYPAGAAAADDWTEFYNNTQSTVPLTGWRLAYVENTIDLGGSANTVWTGQSGQYVNAMSTFLVAGLSLDLNGAQSYHVKLLDASGGLVSQVQWPAGLQPGQSFARISDGHPDYFEIDPTPTKGYANYVSTDALVINEVAYGALETEFIELFNSDSISTRPLAGYALRNAAASAAGQVFRFTRKIYPRDFTAVDGSSSDDADRAYSSVFGAQGLSATGDFLALENSSGSTVSQLTWQSGSGYTRYNYAAQLVPYVNPAPAQAGQSIVRGPADGSHTGVDSADFSVSTGTTLASRNNGAATAPTNTLHYPDPSGGARYLSRRFPLRLTLGANASAGRGNNIVLTRRAGAADPGSPHIYRLSDAGFSLASLAEQATVQFGLQFPDQDAGTLVSGTVYRLILNSDTGGVSAPQVVIASVTYDAAVHSASAYAASAPSWMNDDSRGSPMRVAVSNNSPAGANEVRVATVAFTLLDEALSAPLTQQQARDLFDAVMLVADSTSTGLTGVYEPAIDVATAAYVPMTDISVDSAGLSTLTVSGQGLAAASVVAGSTRSFFVVFASTRDASDRAPYNTFRVRFDPVSGFAVGDSSGFLAQEFTPSAQAASSSFTIISPALPPVNSSWPYVSESSAPIAAAITAYSGDLLGEDRSYLPSTDGTLVALSTSGVPLWTFETVPATPISVPPSLPQEEGGQVYLYFAGENGDVYKLRDNGGTVTEAWPKVSLGAAVKSISDTDSRLYVATADNKLHCRNKSDGSACSTWSFASAVTAPPAGAPSIDERATVTTVWAGLEDGKIVSLKTGDGTSNNTFTTGGPVKSSPYFDAYAASPDNALYITSTDGKIYAINSGNMTAMSGWNHYDTGSSIYTSPFVSSLDAGKYVFFGADNGKLYKLDAATGALIWAFQAGGPIRSSPVVVPHNLGSIGLPAGEDYVYFGCDDGKIYGVNANTGQIRTGWPVATGGPVRADPVADVSAKTLSVGSNDGRLYTLTIAP